MFNSISKNRKTLTERFEKIDVNDIQDSELKAKFRKLKGKQRGFTLLELLVVVAILAAIAGTATLALQDTDARAAAAAHVAMMDELNKGIRTYKALNKEFPNNFDSLIMSSAATPDLTDLATIGFAGTIGAGTHATPGVQVFNNIDLSGGATVTAYENPLLAIEDVELVVTPSGVVEAMDEVGITSVRVVDTTATPDDSVGLNCTDLPELISGRTNAVVAGNIFVGATVNGCGVPADIVDNSYLPYWTGGSERITGVAELATWNADTNRAFMALGVGPASNLFDTTTLGGMTSVPVYRHVSADQYNRFIAIYSVGTFETVTASCSDGASASQAVCEAVPAVWTPASNMRRAEQVQLVSVVDGAGDTKEEELGEWDGTRNTI
mgnify:CR=1 FL=1